MIILQEVAKLGDISITPLSKATSLRQATVTDICKRLEKKKYLVRTRRQDDKRSVSVALTEKGKDAIKELPPLLQETFTDRFAKLDNWEQLMILSAFERVVDLMSADEIDASPIMVTGPIDPLS